MNWSLATRLASSERDTADPPQVEGDQKHIEETCATPRFGPGSQDLWAILCVFMLVVVRLDCHCRQPAVAEVVRLP